MVSLPGNVLPGALIRSDVSAKIRGLNGILQTHGQVLNLSLLCCERVWVVTDDRYGLWLLTLQPYGVRPVKKIEKGLENVKCKA